MSTPSFDPDGTVRFESRVFGGDDSHLLFSPAALRSLADVLDAGSTDLEPEGLAAISPALYGTLAGGAAGLTEPRSGLAASQLLVALSNTGLRLVRELRQTQRDYERTETGNTQTAQTIGPLVGPS